MIDTIITGTKTIDEYKKLRANMQEQAERYSQQHMAATEIWQYGLPVKCWRSDSADLCIEYKSGQWWHYTETQNGLEWW